MVCSSRYCVSGAVVFSYYSGARPAQPPTVLITNNINSAGALNITGITITGANASDFKIASNGSGSSLQH